MKLSRRGFVAGALLQVVLAGHARSAARSRVYELTGGSLYDGNAFHRGTLWVREGRLHVKRPAQIVTDHVDLRGAFVLPPFADAHSHSFGEGQPLEDRARAAAYLRDGVYYVMSQGNLPLSDQERTALGLGSPLGPDVIFANGMLISPDGPVRGFYEAIVFPSGAFPGRTFASLADQRYFTIADVAELDRKWPLVRAQHSDFIKVYLHNSEGGPEAQFAPFFRGRGLDPALLPLIVKRAHAAGLRVSAHVASQGDVLVALDAGVDMLAHVPEAAITSDAAKRVARSGVPIATTMVMRMRAMPPPARAVLERNLKLLREAGAHLVVGADFPADTSAREIDYLAKSGLWTSAELLRMWCITTPKAIFPKRQVGLVDGGPADLLVLADDPLADWSAAHRIERRMRRGEWLS